MLADFGMPDDAFALALISFNVGVEFGQLALIMLCYLALTFWFGQRPWYRTVVIVPGSLVIAAIGIFWTIERLEWL
ncbi:MAG: HupE/UreJ family protein [Thiolinea sp.]